MAVNQVVEKFQDIDPDVWCKILYMEYGKTVAKFYICDKEVVIDGSKEEFTGQRLVDPCHRKTCFLHIRKQSRRSAARLTSS